MILTPNKMMKNMVAKLVSKKPKINARIAGEIVAHAAIFVDNQKVI